MSAPSNKPHAGRRFVVVEGVIGTGKTTLCRVLERARGAEVVLEPHEDNPFLESFYKDPERYALPVQMYFLLTRFRQQDRVRQMSLFHPWIVADYVFQKDRLFAEKTLSEEEFPVYERVAQALGAQVPKPDLIVWLDAPTKVLLERIRQRGVKGEERIERAYLDDLRRRYERLWADWTACPILSIDTGDLDYARDGSAAAEVVARIDAALEGVGVRSASESQPGLFG